MHARSTMMKLAAAGTTAGLLFLILSRPGEAQQAKAVVEPNYYAFVRSMEGTRPDGDIKVAADDILVVNAELARLFDYYLAGVGERSLAEIRAETEREIARRLKPKAAAQAKRLLAQYWSYKEALGKLEQTQTAPKSVAAALHARMAARQQLRMDFFSADEIAGLFGFDDAYDNDAIARLDITQDKSLSAAQKQEKLAALDAVLSPALREEHDAPRKVLTMESAVQQLRAHGASDDEVYRVRAAATSPEAANRLAQLDREEAQWQARIARYQSQRNAVLAEAGTDLEALQQLRDAQFTPDEQRRLGAYE